MVKIPPLEYGEEDSALAHIAPERALYLAVFLRAFVDLFNEDKVIRRLAREWFKGSDAPITFLEIKQTFDLKDSRLKKLDKYIRGEGKNSKKFKRRKASNRLVR